MEEKVEEGVTASAEGANDEHGFEAMNAVLLVEEYSNLDVQYEGVNEADNNEEEEGSSLE